MPVYVNFFYLPEKRGLLPENDRILRFVDHLLEENIVEFERAGPKRVRGPRAGLFTRLKVMVLGEMEKKKDEGPKEEPPAPALFTDMDSDEKEDLFDRDGLAQHSVFSGSQNSYVRIELPYITNQFVDARIGEKADFERGITITRSPEHLPVMDGYENIQCGCKFCKAYVFDPRDHLVSKTKVKCPQCEAEMDLHGLKITPPIKFSKFVVAFEQSKIVDPEDDPKNNGLDLSEFGRTLEPIFGIRFNYFVIYT